MSDIKNSTTRFRVACPMCERVGDMAYCHHFRLYVPPRGFCWAGEPR